MLTLPITVAQHLGAATTEQRSPALLKVTPDGKLISWDGDLQQYGLAQLQPLEPIVNQLFFLDGIFPLQQTRDALPCLQTSDGLAIDVHLFRDVEHSWVLLLDASGQTEQTTRLQQKGNDLSLLRHQYSKLLHRFLQQSLTEDHTRDLLSPRSSSRESQAQEQDICVLLIKICEAHPPAARSSSTAAPEATEVLQTFNACLSIITQIVVDEGGVLNHIFGETAVALFGLLPSQQKAAEQAVYAAKRMIQKFQNVTQTMGPLHRPQLGLGTGITTGTAASAIVRTQHYSALNAVGNTVHRAMQLTDILQANQILIDEATLAQLERGQQSFFGFTPPKDRFEEALYFQAVHS